MPKLTQVKETKRGRYALFFDGEFAFSLDEDTFAMAGLHTGDELEEWQIHDLQTKSDTRKAVDKAMDLLALRDHAAGELYQKLCRSFDPHSAAAGRKPPISERAGEVHDLPGKAAGVPHSFLHVCGWGLAPAGSD